MTTEITFSALPDAATLDGTEIVPIVQGGFNRKTTLNTAALQPYEEGTYDFEFVSVTASIDSDNSRYTRIGNQVFAERGLSL